MATRARSAHLPAVAFKINPITASSVALMLLGGSAILFPGPDDRAATLGWVLTIAGVAHTAASFHPRNFDVKPWRVLIGMLYLSVGLLLAFEPGIGLLPLTLATAFLLSSEGTLLFLSFLRLRGRARSGWILADGVAAFTLGFLVWFLWPVSSAAAIGTLVGPNLVMSGFTLLVFTGAHPETDARRTMTARHAPLGI